MVTRRQSINKNILTSGFFVEGDNNKSKCSFCGLTIPRKFRRLNIETSNYYAFTIRVIRLCPNCIKKMADSYNNKEIEDWLASCFAEKI